MSYTILDTSMPDPVKDIYQHISFTKLNDTDNTSIYACALISNNLFQKKDKYLIILSKKNTHPIGHIQLFAEIDPFLVELKTIHLENIKTSYREELLNIQPMFPFIFNTVEKQKHKMKLYNAQLNLELIVHKSEMKPDVLYKNKLYFHEIFNTCDYVLQIKF